MLANGQLKLTFDAAPYATAAVLDEMTKRGLLTVDLSLDVSGHIVRHQALLPATTHPLDATRLAVEIVALPGVSSVALYAAQRRDRRGFAEPLFAWHELSQWFARLQVAMAA